MAWILINTLNAITVLSMVQICSLFQRQEGDNFNREMLTGVSNWPCVMPFAIYGCSIALLKMGYAVPSQTKHLADSYSAM